MYVVKHTNGTKELNIVVETKDVENKTDLRGTEKAKIECVECSLTRLLLMATPFALESRLVISKWLKLSMKLWEA